MNPSQVTNIFLRSARKQGTGAVIGLTKKSSHKSYSKSVGALARMNAYVGVPADRSARTDALADIAARTTGKGPKADKKRKRAIKQAARKVTNAELLFIHSKGSPLRRIPARPVLEPAIAADGNRQAIAHELAETSKLAMAGEKEKAIKRLHRVAMAGQNAARKWFTDPRNNWAPNSPRTIREKGSSRPLIDFGLLRAAIVGIVREG